MMDRGQFAAAKAEALGAINYTAAFYLLIEEAEAQAEKIADDIAEDRETAELDEVDHVSRAECQGFCGWCGADTDDLRWVKDDESENPVPVQTCARCVRSGDEPTEGRNQSS